MATNQGRSMSCTEPDCVMCQWIAERMIRFNDELKQAILAMAADLPTITYKRRD